MLTFLIAISVCLGIDLIGRVDGVIKGAPPERQYRHYLLDALLNVCLLGWAVGLIVSVK